ncbi:hypothetical protein [Nocardioides pantholopis]|uniref:hypothetical protein n=1 Tax=Nocardioides pantholopis TaxID=2483798 RepID=UPI000FDC3D53|nr:hypothetical protein [Nocardioides pantholopis]
MGDTVGEQRVILHIGLPKTGTSFVQSVLRDNADTLAGHGVRLPDVTRHQVFLGVLHVTDRVRSWGRSEQAAEQAWEQIVAGVRRRPGTVVLSSETLCLASPDQVRRILAELEGVRVDVVVSARDLARQLPAEWQESVKHGRRTSYPAFLRSVLGPVPDGPEEPDEPGEPVEPDEDDMVAGDRAGTGRTGRRFWRAQDLPAVLDRWATAVGVERVHVITCPPPGAPRDLLWRRFAEVAGLAGVPVTLPEASVNHSLGRAQTEVLRRVNQRLVRREDVLGYGDVVKRLYAGTFLRGQGGAKVVLPPAYDERVRELGAAWRDELAGRGYPVVGDLDELVPPPRAEDPGAQRPRTGELLEVSLDATAELLTEVQRLRRENSRLREESERPRNRWSRRLGAGRR